MTHCGEMGFLVSCLFLFGAMAVGYYSIYREANLALACAKTASRHAERWLVFEIMLPAGIFEERFKISHIETAAFKGFLESYWFWYRSRVPYNCTVQAVVQDWMEPEHVQAFIELGIPLKR